jgi:predicted amidohydrolase
MAASTIRVAAVQITAELGNVAANLVKAGRLIRVAFARGATWVVLPEFFSSGIAFHPEMAKAVRAIDGPPAQLLRDLAREGNVAVGGSFLAWTLYREGSAAKRLRDDLESTMRPYLVRSVKRKRSRR